MHTSFMKDGLDGKKMQGKNVGAIGNGLVQSFVKSPHLMGQANYPHIPLRELKVCCGENSIVF